MFVPAISPCLDTQKGGLRGPDTQAYVVGSLPASLGKGLGHNKDEFVVPVAFAQNTRDEVRLIGGDGQIVGALAAQPGMKQTSYIAFDTTQITSPGNFSNPKPGDPCHPLAAGAHPPAVAFAIQDSRPIEKAQNGRGWNADGLAYTIDTQGNQAVAFGIEDGLAHCLRSGASKADKPDSTTYVAQPTTFGETARTLSARHDGSPCADRGPDVVAMAFQSSQSGIRIGDTHATLDANNGSRRHNGIATASAVRRLTPRECERLQGFPDDYTAIPWRKKGSEDCPDGPRYKALGNSMAVPVMRWIGERIAAVEDML